MRKPDARVGRVREGEPRGFAIAGDDKKFAWAKAKIVGKDTIELTADGVDSPKAVRYAWANNPVCNVYGGDGLPVVPFRTDDWPGRTIDNQAPSLPH